MMELFVIAVVVLAILGALAWSADRAGDLMPHRVDWHRRGRQGLGVAAEPATAGYSSTEREPVTRPERRSHRFPLLVRKCQIFLNADRTFNRADCR